jgi:uracil-DNA glycosylase
MTRAHPELVTLVLRFVLTCVMTDPHSLHARLREQLGALPGGWYPLGKAFLASDAATALLEFIGRRERAGAVIYPPAPLRALSLTRFEAVRVVVLGQDPYHGPGQAHGLAFSVPDGVRSPPSLRNIFLELQCDVGAAPRTSGNLEGWARQGVLLLNTVMTVEDGSPASHAKRGWEIFTDAIVDALARDAAPKAFLLWGSHAQAKAEMIRRAGTGHVVLCANHPSPLSARRPPVPFLGCRHFSQANAYLEKHGRGEIDWTAR